MKNKILILAVTFFLSPFGGVGGGLFAQSLPGAGNCLQYNGTSDYVSIANESNFDFDITNSFSIETWVKTTSAGSFNVIYGKLANAGDLIPGISFAIRWGTLNLALVNMNGSTGFILQGTTAINDGNWHYVSATYSGNSDVSGINLYVDGVKETATIILNTNPGSILNNLNANIGARGGVGYASPGYFPGQIDEVRIWNTARSQTEIRNTMCQKLVGNEAGLVGYWRFDETNGTTAVDSQTNVAPNNGTLK